MFQRRSTTKVNSSSLRKQDLFCLFLHYLGFSRIRNGILRLRGIPVARILAFHDVPADLIASFQEKIAYLKGTTNVVNLEDVLSGKLSHKQVNVAITFDDGYQGWYDSVLRVLRDLKVPATFFVSSGFVGLDETKEKNFLRNNLMNDSKTTGSIRVDALKGLAHHGFTIGGHTTNHGNLAMLSNIERLRDELQLDKSELEKITGAKVEYFAYPFGFHENTKLDLVGALRESGYRGAVTVEPGFNTASTDKYLLRRDLVNAAMPMSVFKARIFGNYDGVRLMRKFHERWSRLLGQVFWFLK
jgi:peptidoglycan/xylan/chitin deacetylase (PgdA/CDA1 family)